MSLQAEHRGDIRLASAVGLLLVGTLSAIYMVSQTLRNSIGVIAPDLAAELGLSAAQLGVLSSAFFISFAAAQVPLGIALDRFGPKPCMLACTGIAILGSVLFAMASTPGALIAARCLLGVGSSCYLMAPLAFYARRFEPGSFATVAGIQLGLGTMGTVAATAPLALSASTLGWRATFLLIAAAVAGAGLLVLIVLPGDRTVTDAAGRETLRENLAGTWEALWTRSVFRLFLMQLAAYAGFLVIVGLWGGPYLTHVYGYGLTERGDLLFLAAGGQAVALMLNGPLERWCGNHKVPVLVGSALTAACLMLLAAAGTLSPAMLVGWLLVFGLVSGYTPILIAHGTRLFPPHLLGRGMTLLNIGTMVGVFLSQAITGAIINLFPVSADGAYPLNAYRLVFALQAAFLVVAIVPYLSAYDPLHRHKRIESIT